MDTLSIPNTGARLHVVRLDPALVEIRLDHHDGSANTLDSAFLAELSAALEALQAETALRGVLISSAKEAFLAGADLGALQALLRRTREEQAAFCREMHRVFVKLEDLPVPVVCAINGYALGGGLETALCADYRVLAADAKVGFPEVGFGILPGAGGTVRTPRLTDGAIALDWLVGGRSHGADAALKAGIVDAVCAVGELRESALTWLRRAADGELDWKTRRLKRREGFALDAEALAKARAGAQRSSRHYPAALAIADLIERAAPLSRDAAINEEIETFTSLAQTPTAKALVAVFLSGQQLRKQSKAQTRKVTPLRSVAVLGAGIMGGGIAYTSALKGIPVLLKDIEQGQLDLGMREARKLLDKQVESGRLAPERANAIHASIEPTLEATGFSRVDVVVEAVVENLQVKQDVLRQIEAACGPHAVIASNTSSLSIAEIASALARPQNVVGMHFFNPVHMMPLVEIVRGPQSSDEAVAATVAYANAMGKTPLVVRDCPGFLVNRLLGAYFTAFMQLLRDGADFVQVDRVMETWGWPMGPAYLLDVAGLDTLDKAMAILGRAYPDVMGSDFTTAIQLLASEKRYGQKTGAGFFRYAPDERGKPRRAPDPATTELLARIQADGARSFDDAEILDRMMLAMVLEADRCLETEVVGSAHELDAGMRLGTSFPTHEVGPLWLADRIGLAEVMARCGRYRHLGGLYEPGPGLRRRAAQQQTYCAIPSTEAQSS